MRLPIELLIQTNDGSPGPSLGGGSRPVGFHQRMIFQMLTDGPLQDPLTETVDDDHLGQPPQGSLIQEGFQAGKGLVHPLADQVQPGGRSFHEQGPRRAEVLGAGLIPAGRLTSWIGTSISNPSARTLTRFCFVRTDVTSAS